MTAAVVLAAGASTRLGQPKQLAMLAGETLLERTVRVAREAGCAPVVVVLGASATEICAGCALGNALLVVNREWSEGIASSLRAGVASLGDADGAVLMTCDQPAVTAAHLRALMESGGPAASGYAGRRGVPAYLPAAWFGELMKLRGDAGARELLRDAQVLELPGGELDVDTPESLAEARRIFG